MDLMLTIDKEKASRVAPILYRAFLSEGIHGRMDIPEDRPTVGVTVGSQTHLLFLTLTVSIEDYDYSPLSSSIFRFDLISTV